MREVGIHLPAALALAASCTPARPPSPEVPAGVAARPMTVPESLSASTRFEPSGVLRIPGETRYLVVSDDTGRGGEEGEPWLFAMSASGVVEAEPILVSGVRELDDVEAIAAGSDGEVYLLSSQSYSKKGKRKPSRTALLRLRREGRGYRVTGEVHLAEALETDAELAADLGLTGGTRALDVEGMAFHDGALYLGVKAPLDAEGRAMIWRVASPAALFDAAPGASAGEGLSAGHRLRRAGMSVWARVRVDVEISGQAAPGGISDLAFLPGGSLAITSTPSTADGDAGALWIVDDPHSSDARPRLIERFPGLKPEGLSLSLTAGRLMIVFDTGDRTPLFLEVPWGA